MILPNADAELQIDGESTTSVGSVRNFDTPDLDPGMLYTYTVEAMWISRGEMQQDVRRVDIQAGSRVMVDFTKPAASEAIGKPKTVRSPWQGIVTARSRTDLLSTVVQCHVLFMTYSVQPCREFS